MYKTDIYLHIAERLDIIDHPAHDPDWWLARNSAGQQGLVPKNYIENFITVIVFSDAIRYIPGHIERFCTSIV
ncbi:SH3 domain protein [Cooperia oncophora]